MDALDNHLIPCQMVYKVVYNGYGFRMNSLKTKDDHIPRKLAPVALRKLPDGWHADGGNLYLLVRGTSRSWFFRYTSPIDSKRRNMGLGSL